MANLTAGSCQTLWNTNPENTEELNTTHTVQILSIKKVGNNPNAGNNPDRFRVVMSDGVNYMQAMLATPLNEMVLSETLKRGTVVTLTKISCNFVQDKRLIIILALDIVHPSLDKIGEPVALEKDTPANDSARASPAPVAQPRVAPPVAAPAVPAQRSSAQAGPASSTSATGRNVSVYPIEGLSPYQNNWTIKARVLNKSDMKTFVSARGEGKLFNVTLMDESGEIRGTAFNLAADELFPKLQEGKVYYISKAHVNLAKKKFSNVTNDYELGFHKGTEIEECLETTSLPRVKYTFVKLKDIGDLAKDVYCDVIGVVTDIGNLSEVTSQKQQRTIIKRDLTLVDQTKFSMRVTLWGKHAEQFQAEPKAILAFKGVKVGDFGGRTLAMTTGSTIEINPEIPEAFDLRGWYDEAGSEETFSTFSGAGGAGGGGGNAFNRAELHSIEHIKQNFGLSDKSESFCTKATVMHLKPENISYEACPNCNKKLENRGQDWFCVKDSVSYQQPEHRYLISIAVADYSGQAWLQGFNEVGQALFGVSANELNRLKEADPAEYEKALHAADCKPFNFACRAKQDTFNERTRVRYGISQILPFDYKEEARLLRDQLYSSWAN